jgi:hypothetical protein
MPASSSRGGGGGASTGSGGASVFDRLFNQDEFERKESERAAQQTEHLLREVQLQLLATFDM